MRQLHVLVGPQGSGKTSFLRMSDLLDLSVDVGAIEALHAEPIQLSGGGIGVGPKGCIAARKHISTALARKFRSGQSVFLEFPHASLTDKGDMNREFLASLVETALLRRYAVRLVRFGTIEQEGWLPETLRSRSIAPAESLAFFLSSGLQGLDISGHDRVVFIGDTHGHVDSLRRLFGPDGNRPEVFHVFTGDFVSKGPDSAGVLRYLAEHFLDRPNALMLCGNHELHLEDWAMGQKSQKPDFSRNWPGASAQPRYLRSEARQFLSGLRDGIVLDWHGSQILASHGGLATLPVRSERLPAAAYIFGTGPSVQDVDRIWEANVMSGLNPDPRAAFQVHGHRNPARLPIAAAIGSYNLEGIDSAQELRALVLRRESGRTASASLRLPLGQETTDVNQTPACTDVSTGPVSQNLLLP